MTGLPDAPATSRRDLLRLLLLTLVVLAPLPFGAVRPGAVLALQLVAILAAALALATPRDPNPTPDVRRVLVPAVLLVAIGLAQLVPLPAGLLRVVSQPRAAVVERLISRLQDCAAPFVG